MARKACFSPSTETRFNLPLSVGCFGHPQRRGSARPVVAKPASAPQQPSKTAKAQFLSWFTMAARAFYKNKKRNKPHSFMADAVRPYQTIFTIHRRPAYGLLHAAGA